MSQFLSKRGGTVLISLTNAPVNGLAHNVRSELLRNLEKANAEKATAVILMGSGKHFSAGADIKEFTRGGHQTSPSLADVISYLDSFPAPIVAGIHGTALGGGLETALACHWRLANETALIGLPEVKLGLLPGAGGTQRLPRLVGVSEATKLMTQGRLISSNEAFKLGIVDNVFKSSKITEDLIDAAVAFSLSDEVQGTPVNERRVSNMAVKGDVSEELFKNLYGEVFKQSRGFVAPLSILEAIKAAATSESFEEGLQKERELFEGLMKGPQSKALQYIFFSERRSSTLPADIVSTVTPAPIVSAAVVGGGTMGCGIAISCANAGIPTTLLEVSLDKAQTAKSSIEKTYKSSSAFKSGKQTEEQVASLMSLIKTTTDYADLSKADIVIEAGFEKMEVKKQIFQQLDKVCKENAILATNTSYLDIDEIASSTNRSSSVIGTHFFSPANIMQLLEVVRGKNTSNTTIQSCMSLGKKLKKTPILAGNCFGFIGNRMLEPYLKEAQHLVEEGASPAQVDRVMKEKVGFAMGPFEMSDLAGIDIGWQLRKDMTEIAITNHKLHINDEEIPTIKTQPSTLPENDEERVIVVKKSIVLSDWYSSLPEKLCEKGYLGQKTGRGFYLYIDPLNRRKPSESFETLELIKKHREDMGYEPREISDQEIIERCLYPLINEGFKVLEEGIALRPEDIDIAYLYGYGFPKYRGGPLFWAEREVGFAKVYAALKSYHDKNHQRPWLKPSELLVSVVESGASLKEELYFNKINRNK